MKTAKVVLVYKAKEKHLFTNYRPISLLSIFSKLLERLVYNRLYNFLDAHEILDTNQYGFRSKRSTTDAVTHLYGDIIKCLDNREKVLAVFCDLSKAFDTIDHGIMLHKLKHYDIRGGGIELVLQLSD